MRRTCPLPKPRSLPLPLPLPCWSVTERSLAVGSVTRKVRGWAAAHCCASAAPPDMGPRSVPLLIPRQLLALLLSFGSADMFFTAGSPDGRAEGPAAWAEFSTGIFERLARALTDAPYALDDLASLIEGIKMRDGADAVIPGGFAALWADVLEARAATS